MDRRQQKTRNAIFKAFIALLSKESFSRITVQEIIDKADVGRTTFYAHFISKEALLKALCEELFSHIFRSTSASVPEHGLYSDDSVPDSVFCHLLQHLKKNDNNILALLSCSDNEIFLSYFRENLNSLVHSLLKTQIERRNDIPQDFLVNHISGSFVEMVLWWIRDNLRESPERLDRYFRAVIEPIL